MKLVRKDVFYVIYNVMQRRMSQLKKREKRMDVDAWVQSFLHTMGAIFDDKVRLNFKDRPHAP